MWNDQEKVVRKLNENSENWDLVPIRELGGLSGALVFIAQNRTNYQLWVIKSFENKAQAEKEFNRSIEAQKCFHYLGFGLNPIVELDVGACFAMTMAAGGKTTTFTEVLRRAVRDGDISVAERVLEIIEGKLCCSVPMLKSVRAFHDVSFDNGFKVRLKQLSEDDFNEFMVWWDQKKNSVNRNIQLAPAHGDFHADNILVSQDVSDLKERDVFLIDFGCFDNFPIFKDYARLERHIRFAVLETGDNAKTNMEEEFLKMQEMIDIGLAQNQDVESGVKDVVAILRKLHGVARNAIVGDTGFEFDYVRLLEFVFFAGSPLDGRPLIQRKAALKAALRLSRVIDSYIEREIISRKGTVLWRLAYAFLRLDQQPSGGWARSLPNWIRNYYGETEQQRYQSSIALELGGLNLTCNAVFQYVRGVCDVIECSPDLLLDQGGQGLYSAEHETVNMQLKLNELREIEGRNEIVPQVMSYIAKRISEDGALRSYKVFRDTRTEIHHTLLGVTCLLLSYLLSGGETNEDLFKLIRKMAEWLIGRKDIKWNVRGETKRQYSIYCNLTFLSYLLSKAFFRTSDPGTRGSLDNLVSAINTMRESLKNESPYPDKVNGISDFLLNLFYLISFDGYRLLEDNENFLKNPLKFIKNNGSSSLVTCNMGGLPATDWGHSAEYFWISTLPSIWSTMDVAKRREEAIQVLFNCLEEMEYFRFTHGVSFSYAMGLCDPISKGDFEELDEKINNVLRNGITERSIVALITWIFKQGFADIPDFGDDPHKDAASLNYLQRHKLFPIISNIKTLLINKLEPGSYLPYLTNKQAWGTKVKEALISTKAFFESDLGMQNIEANSRLVSEKKWLHISNYFSEGTREEKRWLLDVGCGSATHAINLFFDAGYNVHFYDYSSRVENLIKETLASRALDPSRYRITRNKVEFLNSYLDTGPNEIRNDYEIIFADGIACYIEGANLKGVLTSLNRILAPNGILFINFKIRDHTLISLDGRFFEYHANHEDLKKLLEQCDFRVEDITLTRKEDTMYKNTYPTYWAHFICSKKTT